MTAVDTTFLIDLEISDSPRHKKAMKIFNTWFSKKNTILAIFNQSFLEYQHVVTDPRRFNQPLTMDQAIERCWYWIDNERTRVIYPDDTSLKRANMWMNMYGLGRKRIQDTHMASAFLSNNIDRIITATPKDFEIFEAFEIIGY